MGYGTAYDDLGHGPDKDGEVFPGGFEHQRVPRLGASRRRRFVRCRIAGDTTAAVGRNRSPMFSEIQPLQGFPKFVRRLKAGCRIFLQSLLDNRRELRRQYFGTRCQGGTGMRSRWALRTA